MAVKIEKDKLNEYLMKKTGLKSSEIGVFFISPCPAKVTSVRSPLGYEKSDVDGVLAMKNIYPELINKMSVVAEKDELVWDIAKRYNPSAEAILSENGIEEGETADGMLLIPIV